MSDHELCARETSKLRVALRFYADEATYEPDYDLISAIGEDRGAKAREALR